MVGNERWVFQVADVNKILACVGMVADAGNGVLFMREGGTVLTLAKDALARLKELIEKCPVKTSFDGTGNTHVMEACVKVDGKAAS